MRPRDGIRRPSGRFGSRNRFRFARATAFKEIHDEFRAYVPIHGLRGDSGGIVLIHSATWTKPEPSADVAAAVGVGGFQRYRHGSLTLEIADADHPICLGLPSTVRLEDESYWPPSPPRGSSGIQILAGSREQADPDEAASSLHPMFWTFELGKGRVFGCVPGHNNWTFDHPYFRLLLLRGMAWAAHETPYRFDDLALRSAAIADP